MTNFASMLKKLRKKQDITQEQLAEYLNISPQAVSRWETEGTQPDITVLPLLAELFGVTVDELLGINEDRKREEIFAIIKEAEERIDNNTDLEDAIMELRDALMKYPYNDKLLCSLLYGLYVITEDTTLLEKYDHEIISIAERIEKYSKDIHCILEARRLLFRHYCDTGRKSQALLVAEQLPSIEASHEINMYWALDEEERIHYLKNKMLSDLQQLKWDIAAYTKYADLSNDEKLRLQNCTDDVENTVNRFMQEA